MLCFFFSFPPPAPTPSVWIPDWANFKILQGSGPAFLPLRYSLPHYLTASALVSPADGIQFPFHSQQPRIISLIHLETQWSLPLRMQTLSQSNLLIYRALFLAFHSLTWCLGCCIFFLGKELNWLLGTWWRTFLQDPKIEVISYILLSIQILHFLTEQNQNLPASTVTMIDLSLIPSRFTERANVELRQASTYGLLQGKR